MAKETIKCKKLFFDAGNGEVAEFSGGGTDGRPNPNSVGTEELEDEGVKMPDLEKDIQKRLEVLDDENVVTEDELEDCWQEAMQNAGLDLGGGTQEAGAGEDSVEGGGADLD